MSAVHERFDVGCTCLGQVSIAVLTVSFTPVAFRPGAPEPIGASQRVSGHLTPSEKGLASNVCVRIPLPESLTPVALRPGAPEATGAA